MAWQSAPYSVPLLVAAAICLVVAALAWPRRARPGGTVFLVLMLGVAVWSGGYALEILSPGLEAKVFWAKVQYLGIVVVPSAWLAFALLYTDRIERRPARWLWLLLVEPIVILVLLWNPGTEPYLWTALPLDRSASFPMLVLQRGLWFWVHVGYSYVALAIATVLVVRLSLRSTGLYRKQAIVVILAACAPWIGNVVFLTRLSPLIDPTPFAFTLTGLATFWGLIRLHFLDIVPVARTAVFEGMRDGVLVLDDENRILDLNPGAEVILGRAGARVVGTSIFSVLDGEPSIREILVGENEVRSEAILPDATGGEETRILDLLSWPLYDKRSRHRGRILVLRDITRQRRSEAALRASEERLRVMIEQMPAVLWVTDSDLIFTLSLGAGLGALDLEPNEVVGTSLFEFFGTEDPAFLPVAAHVRALRGEASAFEFEWKSAKFECHVEPLLAPDGQTNGAIGVALDVSERERLQEQLRQSQKMEAIGRMAGGVAHDFNNLLTAVAGYAQLAQEDLARIANDPGAIHNLRRDIDAIEHASERATSLTGQLLAFSRRQVLQPRVVDLNSVVDDVETMARRLVGERVQITTAFDPDLRPVKADPVQIQQVVINLVLNARDAMSDGGKVTIETSMVELSDEVRMRFDVIPPGRYIMLAVSDNGSGMDEVVQSHLFEPFFTTKEEGRGTGLGLSTVYGIVKQSNGHIEVRSAVGEGSTFKIYFPAMEGPLDEIDDREPPSEMLQGSETILLVEDEEIVRVLATRVLSTLGYRVLEAAEAEEAIGVCRQHEGPIDLVVTDVVMPGMSGTELAAELDEILPGTPVLFISGYTGGALVQHGVLEEGMNFLQKPFSRESLAQRVRELLDRD